VHLRGENRLSRKVLHSHVIITDVMNSGVGSTLVVSTSGRKAVTNNTPYAYEAL